MSAIRFRYTYHLIDEEFQEFLADFEIFIDEQSKKRDRNKLDGRRIYNLTFSFFPETKSISQSKEVNEVL